MAGLHRPSITLADLTVRRPVARALDMGTGFGIQAILAAHHAERVIATDINPRALAFARFNAALNGASNIEFRHGSFFEPVDGEHFGLVVTNPPYVISPENEYLFRDSGMGRDRVSERLVMQLPDYLEDGGYGTILVSWIPDSDESTARPRSWLEGTGCDAWILETAVEDALASAGTWNRDLESDPPAYSRAIERWTAYYAAEGVRRLAYAAIVMRRGHDGRHWVRTHGLPGGHRTRPEAHVLRLFSGPDLSDRLSTDDALAKEHLSLAEGSVISSRNRFGDHGWAEANELTLDVGIPFSAELDRTTAEFLLELDGTRALGDILAAFARERDAPPQPIRVAGLAVTRKLLELGLVAPVPADATQLRH